MHILVIASWYKTPQHPVTGTFFEEQARMFQKRGHQVGILYPNHDIRFLGTTRSNGERTPTSFIDKGIPTYYSFTESISPKKDYPTKADLFTIYKKAYRTFSTYVKAHGKPDVIHAHATLYAGIVAKYISKKENLPYFLTKHYTEWILSEKIQKFKAFERLLCQVIDQSAKTFIVSRFYQEELEKKYAINTDKTVILPNIVNELFYKNNQNISLSQPVHLIVIGYLVERKNHLTLFKAVKQLLQKNENLILNVVGNGSYEANLKHFVRQHQLEKEIIFHGLKDRQDVLELLKKSHILVSASIFETFGVNIIEALAVGRPIVALDSGGPRDIVTPKDGVLIKDNTPEAFARAIKEVIQHYDNYDQDDLSKRCAERFGEEAIYKVLMEYYLSCLN